MHEGPRVGPGHPRILKFDILLLKAEKCFSPSL